MSAVWYTRCEKWVAKPYEYRYNRKHLKARERDPKLRKCVLKVRPVEISKLGIQLDNL